MFAVVIAFVCCYRPERILSAIAKFFCLFDEGQERAEMGEGREWGGKEEGRKIGMHEKIAPNRNKFGIWGRPLGDAAPCHTF